MLKIEFTASLGDYRTEDEARAVVATLVSLYGTAALPDDVARHLFTTSEKDPDPLDPGARRFVSPTEAFAPDGYPTQPPADNAHVAPGASQFPDLDSAGVPWDERIHAGTKTKNKDLTWTRRRNTPDEVFNAVMAELTGAPAAPEPTAAEAFTPPASVVIPAVPAPPTPPVPAPAPTADAAPTFVQIMQRITPLQAARKLDPEGLKSLLAQCGLDSLGKLAPADDGTRAAFSALLAQYEA